MQTHRINVPHITHSPGVPFSHTHPHTPLVIFVDRCRRPAFPPVEAQQVEATFDRVIAFITLALLAHISPSTFANEFMTPGPNSPASSRIFTAFFFSVTSSVFCFFLSRADGFELQARTRLFPVSMDLILDCFFYLFDDKEPTFTKKET